MQFTPAAGYWQGRGVDVHSYEVSRPGKDSAGLGDTTFGSVIAYGGIRINNKRAEAILPEIGIRTSCRS